MLTVNKHIINITLHNIHTHKGGVCGMVDEAGDSEAGLWDR